MLRVFANSKGQGIKRRVSHAWASLHSACRAACLGLYHTGAGPFRTKSRALGIDHEQDQDKPRSGTFPPMPGGQREMPWESSSVEASGMAGLDGRKEGLGDLS